MVHRGGGRTRPFSVVIICQLPQDAAAPDGQEVTPEMSTEDLESSAADDTSPGESTPASEAAAESSAR